MSCMSCTERQSWLPPTRRWKGNTEHGGEQEKLSHHSSTGPVVFFFSIFHLLLRKRETIVLFEKESLEKGKCACLLVCKEWGVQEGKMKFSGLKRQQSGFLVLQYTWCLSKNNPCVCEIKLLKTKGKCIVLLYLIHYYFFKTEVG